MPVFMVTMPNPRSRDDWPEHWDGGAHYVRPFKLEAKIALVIAFAIAAHTLRKQKKAAKECY
jgi:hypothetical protein